MIEPNPGPAFGFSQSDHARVGRATRFVEAKAKNASSGRAKYPIAVGGTSIDVITGKTTTSIPGIGTAANGFPQPGTGSVMLLRYDGTYLYIPVFALPIGAGGSGYTDGTYALGVAGGAVLSGFDAVGTFTVASGAVTSAAITDGGRYTYGGAAPTISFPGAGGSGATCTPTMGETVTASNSFTGSVSTAKYVKVVLSADGYYSVLAEDC